jgi:hypothetical protein
MDEKEIKEIIKRAEESIMQTQESIDNLKAKLADKPKLRHGDYGIWKWDAINNDLFVIMEQGTLEGSPKAFFADGGGQVNANEYFNGIKLGNIFDDLAAMSEDVEEAEIDGVDFELNAEGVIAIAHRYRFRKADHLRLKKVILALISTSKRKAL